MDTKRGIDVWQRATFEARPSQSCNKQIAHLWAYKSSRVTVSSHCIGLLYTSTCTNRLLQSSYLESRGSWRPAHKVSPACFAFRPRTPILRATRQYKCTRCKFDGAISNLPTREGASTYLACSCARAFYCITTWNRAVGTEQPYYTQIISIIQLCTKNYGRQGE